MGTRHLDLGSSADWAIAVVFLAATVGVGTLIVRELTSIAAPPPPVSRPAAPVVPNSLPALSIPVDVLPLGDGEDLRLGDSIDKVSRLLGRDAETDAPRTEQAKTGLRITRFYQRRGVRFVLVLEPFERNGALRVAGIYVR